MAPWGFQYGEEDKMDTVTVIGFGVGVVTLIAVVVAGTRLMQTMMFIGAYSRVAKRGAGWLRAVTWEEGQQSLATDDLHGQRQEGGIVW